MFDETKEPASANDLAQSPSLLKKSPAQPAGISTPPPVESERVGLHVEFERALTEWILRHRHKWSMDREPAAQPIRIRVP